MKYISKEAKTLNLFKKCTIFFATLKLMVKLLFCALFLAKTEKPLSSYQPEIDFFVVHSWNHLISMIPKSQYFLFQFQNFKFSQLPGQKESLFPSKGFFHLFIITRLIRYTWVVSYWIKYCIELKFFFLSFFTFSASIIKYNKPRREKAQPSWKSVKIDDCEKEKHQNKFMK